MLLVDKISSTHLQFIEVCKSGSVTNHQVIPVSLAQDEALHVCSILKAELSFPNKTEELWSKKSKFHP